MTQCSSLISFYIYYLGFQISCQLGSGILQFLYTNFILAFQDDNFIISPLSSKVLHQLFHPNQIHSYFKKTETNRVAFSCLPTTTQNAQNLDLFFLDTTKREFFFLSRKVPLLGSWILSPFTSSVWPLLSSISNISFWNGPHSVAFNLFLTLKTMPTNLYRSPHFVLLSYHFPAPPLQQTTLPDFSTSLYLFSCHSNSVQLLLPSLNRNYF